MQAIQTRYIGPTNTKPARIRAKCDAKTIYVSYDHALDVDDNHAAACSALRKNKGWADVKRYDPMFGGVFAGDYYWVFPVEWCKAA